MNWIKVTDRLPEQRQRILIFNGKDIFYGFLSGNYFNDEADKDVYYGNETINNVTHWMPLPEPPKD